MYALSVADNLLRAGQSRRAIVIGAETFTRLLIGLIEGLVSCLVTGLVLLF